MFTLSLQPPYNIHVCKVNEQGIDILTHLLQQFLVVILPASLLAGGTPGRLSQDNWLVIIRTFPVSLLSGAASSKLWKQKMYEIKLFTIL